MSFPEEELPKPVEPASSEALPSPIEPAGSDEPPSEEIVFPEEPILPDDFTPLDRTGRKARARRRRAHRKLVWPGADERAAILDDLARRAFPTFEFFVFALLCGAVLGAAYLMDSPAILLLGILLAPLLTSWVGMILAIQTGSWRFFFLTLGGLLSASLLVFLTGALAGWAGRLWLHLPLTQAKIHSLLWWPELFLVALGAVLLTISFVRFEQRPILPSIMLAYGLFMPLSASGVGLGMGVPSIWPNGALVFLVHLALATLVGCITLAALHFKPLKAGGYLLPIFIWLLCLGALVSLTGVTKVIRDEILVTRQTVPTPTMTVLPSDTPTELPTATMTSTFTPSDTPQPTATAQPTPAYAVIAALQQYGGANVRSEPAAGVSVSTLTNGILVQVLPEIQSVNGNDWVHVRWGSVDGWVLTTVLKATTQVPTPVPSLTSTATP